MRCVDVITTIIKGSQLHCFSSTTEVVQQWLESFPSTHFSISNMANSFNSRQRAALKSVPRNKLLLDTDAPYLPPVGKKLNAPSLLDYTAESVATILGDISPEEVLELTETNARAFFH
ncbi:3'-5' ssDNA/RNA exonuclease TatD-like [Patiria miniata]|uniref:Uncharacterized protein n=1 Tax=Patiria miniata TaxID=46514 RepID=A0A914AEI1_PATMI|nr:3'-5' ssDNA/RNA exonuclease TatD-like [Patiria miniata]